MSGLPKPLQDLVLSLERAPVTGKAPSIVKNSHAAISGVLLGRDDRLIIVGGPRTIHEPDQDIYHAFAEPDIKSRYQVLGYEAFDISRAKLPAFVAGESAKYGEVIRRTKISLD